MTIRPFPRRFAALLPLPDTENARVAQGSRLPQAGHLALRVLSAGSTLTHNGTHGVPRAPVIHRSTVFSSSTGMSPAEPNSRLGQRFDHRLAHDGRRTVIESTCRGGHVTRLVSMADSSLETWERDHTCPTNGAKAYKTSAT